MRRNHHVLAAAPVELSTSRAKEADAKRLGAHAFECAKHKIVSEIDVIPVQQINEAYERMLRSDVRYRFVIDISTL